MRTYITHRLLYYYAINISRIDFYLSWYNEIVNTPEKRHAIITQNFRRNSLNPVLLKAGKKFVLPVGIGIFDSGSVDRHLPLTKK